VAGLPTVWIDCVLYILPDHDLFYDIAFIFGVHELDLIICLATGYGVQSVLGIKIDGNVIYSIKSRCVRRILNAVNYRQLAHEKARNR
jgi:hypothetical protein